MSDGTWSFRQNRVERKSYGFGPSRTFENRFLVMSAIKTVPCRCSSSPAATLAEPAPSLEIEFWDSLAEAFLRYYGKAITLKVFMMFYYRTK